MQDFPPPRSFSIPLLVAILCLALFACHQPERFVAEGVTGTDSSATTSVGLVSPINTGMQICNPAISGDTVNFPGSMLWLGFSGKLVVKDPPATYGTTSAIQHDRLTISREDNSVAWFILKDSVPGVQCEFQDPDWSAHPEWLVSMGAKAEHGNCDNDEFIYSGWVIRPSDNARFRFNRDGLDGISTPHAWFAPGMAGPDSGRVVDTAQYNSAGLATQASVEDYFGSTQVKFSWSKAESGYTIHYIDYSETSPQDRILSKPVGRETWKAESGMISPDGKWIAYNLYERQDLFESYVQELKIGSVPALISATGMDPRWWVSPTDPTRIFIVFMTVPATSGYLVQQDLLDAAVLQSGSAGATWLQEIKLSPGLPSSLALEIIGAPRKLVNLPFRGGLSPDGRFLATGTNDGYMMELY
jgi:hypothetical protein